MNKSPLVNQPVGSETTVPRDQHGISRQDISDSALKVMYRLNKSGFQAYLVGGSVRDILLGSKPKDFDVATDATPDHIRALFRNSRIIGRRFKIVHVRFGREIIEVTTFRGHHDSAETESTAGNAAQSNHRGMLVRDNVYGTLEEDAIRRDLTVNALYYSVADFSVRDFCSGLEDLRAHIIRVIGNAELRYREDPVRMLRTLRFAAKLNFTIEPNSGEPIRQLAYLLEGIAPARLFDETLKLFMHGYAEQTFELLLNYEVFFHLFPAAHVQKTEKANVAKRLIKQAFINTDKRIQAEKTVTPAFIFAALLWPSVLEKIALNHGETPTMAELQQAANEVIQLQNLRTSIPKRFQFPMKEIWEMQLRLPRRNGRRASKLMEHPRFRAGYDFLLLREQAGEIDPGLGQWWTEFQEQEPANRHHIVEKLDASSIPPRRNRRRRTTEKQHAH